MRLAAWEVQAIVAAIEETARPAGCRLLLFGSRADDGQKGGDIDLLLVFADTEGRSASQRRRLDLLLALQRRLGERKVDLVIAAESDVGSDPFLAAVVPGAVELKRWALPSLA